ncbi:MAG TPA: hypothetical protein VKF62_02990, partial [Planctomycetota bacterium]|nr:hypothetical protein [Planctomycetota bacterium]
MTRTTWTAAGVAAFLLIARAGADGPAPTVPAPAASPGVLTLDRAVAQGVVEVRGAAPQGFSSVLLTLENRTESPVVVDVSGRHLVPTTGPVQRLGLSHPTTPVDPEPGRISGTFPIRLTPHERREIRMNSCCPDAGKGSPGPKDRYVVSSSPTPPLVEAALRWWTDHPKAPQGMVNSAIWQEQLALLREAPRRGEREPAPAWPKGRFVRSYGGVLYLLEDGVLTSVDAEGTRRFHATGIYQVFPDADGLVAVGRGVSGRELWRFGVTGDPPWTKLFSLEDAIDGLLCAPGGAFL